MLPLIPLAISLAPTIAKWLFGSDAAQVVEQVGTVVSQVTGVADPHSPDGLAAVETALQAHPELAMQLQVQLAQIAAQREAEADRAAEAQRKADLDALSARLMDVAGARAQTIDLAKAGSKIAWGAPVVSTIVLITFGVVVTLAFTRALPPGSETLLSILIGALAAWGGSVVSYWVGSSAGSANKTDVLADGISNKTLAIFAGKATDAAR